jgi:23S rRNA (cytosine1962-C5)-methyltransferase
MTTIILKQGKDQFVRRFHPWIFSGAIARIEGKPNDGEVVEVLDFQRNFLAKGHYHKGSISVKIFSFEQVEANEDFWLTKIQEAYKVRQMLNFTDTNCFRLVHGEGDNCPGLIIDYYNGVAVIQAHSIGMHLERTKIVSALQQVFGKNLIAIYDKSHETLPEEYAKNIQNDYLWGRAEVPFAVKENNNSFLIDWETGQKTGFFLDQRDNRDLLGHYAKNKKLLNAFCYSGGFSVYALRAGASEVVSVDVSAKAIHLTEKNVEANFTDTTNHVSVVEDVLKYLKNTEEEFEVMVLDPPAFAKSMDARHRAVQGYKRLNIEGLKKLKKGGILFTFSCSQVVDRELFHNTVVAAAIEAGRQVRVLHHLTQPADHPVNFFHPEGSYLKGLVLYVS